MSGQDRDNAIHQELGGGKWRNELDGLEKPRELDGKALKAVPVWPMEEGLWAEVKRGEVR